jgi:hypothetical protein
MPTDRAIVLVDAAIRVAKWLRTDPMVAELLDPAVFIAADDEHCYATLIERLELIGMMSEIETAAGEPLDDLPDGAGIAVLVADKSGATIYIVPDPRTHPWLWPWMGPEEDKC